MSFFTENRINHAIVYLHSELRTLAETGDYASVTTPELSILFIAKAAGQVENTTVRTLFSSLLAKQTRKERSDMCRRLVSASKLYQKKSLRFLIPEMEQCYTLGIHATASCEENGLAGRKESLGYHLAQTLLEAVCGTQEMAHV